ncbi:uncharacterized protein L969DRAFT_17793 [Mixia osmundae IAM 14324]|uniref:Nucleoporin Pom152 n=1 Tax=Mixia osmundae (strain CBS 9802 / IAM 14324 / JCM 22182 / KY 12970) TaxID=764103 RepID=G7E1Y8_MIXOS|nr:uncharacterized protein L969DRAFT_17793 [Mixia osmundae IAM 14324]KEI38719.1 hypothetical protein L969DRAFT_17793 [Mixia osmundae IAM 14324]GAA96825.1 hypothetical protein E5Q_03497 [Mixia osmundae IAM 14324]
MAAASSGQPAGQDVPPRISADLIDPPTQRLYLVSLFVGLQSYKIYQLCRSSLPLTVLESLASASLISDGTLTRALYLLGLTNDQGEEAALPSLITWILLDLVFCLVIVPLLRIPRLRPALLHRAAACGLLCFIDFAFLGNYTLSTLLAFFVPGTLSSIFDYRVGLSETRVRLSTVMGTPQSHLEGQKTVRILAFATARFEPLAKSYCLSSEQASASLPIEFNNTVPAYLQYSVAPFDGSEQKSLYNITASELISPSSTGRTYDDLDDDDEWSERPAQRAARQPVRAKQTKIYHLKVPQTGLIRLERILDRHDVDIRLPDKHSPLLIVQCPQASFAPLQARASRPRLHDDEHLCEGQQTQYDVHVRGVAPLSVSYRWQSLSTAKQQEHIGKDRSKTLKLESLVQPGSPAHNLLARSDYRWAEPQQLTVPIKLTTTHAGIFEYSLDTVTDALGNRLDIASQRERSTAKGNLEVRKMTVYAPAQISFLGCDDEPARLLRGRSTSLNLQIEDGTDAPWTIRIAYTPEAGATAKSRAWDLTSSERNKRFAVSDPGSYDIVSVKGSHCPGAVLLPSTCRVIDQPAPSANIVFERIRDDCAGEIGIRVKADLTGVPPFNLHYRTLRDGRVISTKSQRILRSREEINLQPDTPGSYTYEFDRLDDRHYSDIRLSASVAQTVHSLSSARFTGPGDRVLWSCQAGETLETNVELSGVGPWSLKYGLRSGQTSQREFVAKDIKAASHILKIPLPADALVSGNRLVISLISVTDARGCQRSLTVPDVNIEIKTTNPVASFAVTAGEANVKIRAGDSASLPIRLSGEGPWTVEYRHSESKGPPRKAIFRSHNADLLVDMRGSYELVSVRDQHCPGTIDRSHAKYGVEFLPRPAVRAIEGSSAASNGSVILPPVCEGTGDAFQLQTEGQYPLELAYTIQGPGSHKESKTVQAAQQVATIMLDTSFAGHRIYTVTSVSDTLYIKPRADGVKSPVPGIGKPLRYEQDVLKRPDAIIKVDADKQFCAGQSISSMPGLTVHFSGQAPFEATFEVREEGQTVPDTFTVDDIRTSEWAVDLPYPFDRPGRHLVALKSVSDATGCRRDDLGTRSEVAAAGAISKTIIVAESAAIKAVQAQRDHCVGDVLDYVLQGAAPWTITTEFNGKRTTVTTRKPLLSRLAESPGNFSIVDIAHKGSSCKSTQKGLQKIIHGMPIARVDAGSVDIREGDEAEVIFTFTGTPPFAFTYIRSAGKGRRRRVEETHTITGLMESTYTVYTSLEGTWEVTYVADAFCAYPQRPVSSDTLLLKD